MVTRRGLATVIVGAILVSGAMLLVWHFWPGSKSESLSASGNPGPWTVEQVRAFQDYTVLWLGEEYNGLPLTEVIRDVADDDPKSLAPMSEDAFEFTYGTCTIEPGDDACAIPLTLIIEPRCYLPPELLAADQKTGPLRSVRQGAEQQDFSGGQAIWTGDIVVSILGSVDPGQVAQALRPINGASDAASPLAAPDRTQCSKIRGRDRSRVIEAMTPSR